MAFNVKRLESAERSKMYSIRMDFTDVFLWQIICLVLLGALLGSNPAFCKSVGEHAYVCTCITLFLLGMIWYKQSFSNQRGCFQNQSLPSCFDLENAVKMKVLSIGEELQLNGQKIQISDTEQKHITSPSSRLSTNVNLATPDYSRANTVTGQNSDKEVKNEVDGRTHKSNHLANKKTRNKRKRSPKKLTDQRSLVEPQCISFPHTVMVLVIVLSVAMPGNSAVITDDNELRKDTKAYPLLMTPQCSDREDMLKSSCGFSDQDLRRYVDFCHFSELCVPGTGPKCIDTDNGIVYICFEEHSVCPKGHRKRAWLAEADPFNAQITQEKCPAGTYQPTESNCFDACRFKHKSLAGLGEEFDVYSAGDNSSPILVFCDYRKGYYNPGGEFLFDFDDSPFPPHICLHVDDINPCVNEQYPLANGTCVSACPGGLCRDKNNGFQCKKSLGTNGCFDGPATHVSKSNVLEDLMPLATATTTRKVPVMAEPEWKSKENSKTVVLMAVAIILLLICLVIVFLLLFRYLRRFCWLKTKTDNQSPKYHPVP